MSDIFVFKSGNVSYAIEEPSKDEEKWLIISDDKYRPDKSKFVFDKFQKDYPSIKAINAEQVYKLASRSVKLNEWLAKTNAEYAVIEGAPTYFRQYAKPDEFDAASKEVLKLSKAQALKAREQADAAIKYRENLAEIDTKYERLLTTSDKIAKILSLNTTVLPLSVQLAIENYTPAKSSSPTAKAYARECLVSYKIALLKTLQKDKDTDIDKLITENMEK